MKKTLSIIMALVVILTAFSMTASASSLRKLDLAFVIDTTGSMEDDIEEVKENMHSYLEELEETGADFRVAIIDYRDFAARAESYDYPYKVQLDFTSNYTAIQNGIDSLDLGHGGDTNETIYSALIDGLDELSWRKDAGKSVILMGDAPALDPEPYTEYTKADAIRCLMGNGIALTDADYGSVYTSRSSADAIDRSPITLFGIATSNDREVVDNFKALSSATNGKTYVIGSTEEISEVVSEIIETIPEVVDDPSSEESIFDMIIRYLSQFFNIIQTIIDMLS